MGWSNGTFSRVHDWTADEASAIDIQSTRMDQEDDNFATGIDTCLTKDGSNEPTADLPMGGNRHTGVGNANALDGYASAADVIDQHLTYYVDSGAADAYVITPSPAITAYAEGQRFVFRATNANTGAATLNVNGLGAIDIETPDAYALTANMILLGGYYEVIYDSITTPDRWVLMSPPSTVVQSTRSITAGAGLTGGGDLSAERTLDVGAGTGITVETNAVALDTGSTRNVAHNTVSVTAGSGLTGGGDISANRTINVAAATNGGIAVNNDDIALDIDDLTIETTLDINNDYIAFADNSATNATRKMGAKTFRDNLGLTQYWRKSGNQNFSSITLADVTDFTSISIDSNSWYKIDAFIYGYQNGGGLKLNWAFTQVPQNDPGIWHVMDALEVESWFNVTVNTTIQINAGILTDGQTWIARFNGSFLSHATTGATLKLQAAKGASAGGDTNVNRTSYVSVRKIA